MYFRENGRTLIHSVTFTLIITLINYIISISYAEEKYTLPQNPLEGVHLFLNKGCINCHAIKGYGGVGGSDLGKTNTGISLMDMAGIMWNHAPYMAAAMKERKVVWPKFNGKEMAMLIAYLYYVDYFDEPGNPEVGKKIFEEKKCVKCHNINQENIKKIGPSLDKFSKNSSVVTITQSMWNHGPKMAVKMEALGIQRPGFEGKEIIDLLAYIRNESKGEPGEMGYVLPGNPKEGRKLFLKKNCIRCHSIREEGGKIGPDLSEKSKELYRSVSQVAGIMWNHGPGMWAKMKEMGIELPEFSANEMADLIAFLYFIRYFDEEGDPMKGLRLVNEKQCISCHSSKGEVGNAGGDLTKVEDISSPIDFAAKMWNHAPYIYNKVKENKIIGWPLFQKGEMASLLSYLEALQGK